MSFSVGYADYHGSNQRFEARYPRRIWFFQSVSGEKTILAVRFAPRNSKNFSKPQYQIQRIKNPQIFDAIKEG